MLVGCWLHFIPLFPEDFVHPKHPLWGQFWLFTAETQIPLLPQLGKFFFNSTNLTELYLWPHWPLVLVNSASVPCRGPMLRICSVSHLDKFPLCRKPLSIHVKVEGFACFNCSYNDHLRTIWRTSFDEDGWKKCLGSLVMLMAHSIKQF